MESAEICPRCHKRIETTGDCSWECRVEDAKRKGGRAIQPNGLPVRCIKANGDLLEHEHGDHADYKFPVHAQYIGPVTDVERQDFEMACGRAPRDDDEVRRFHRETHALIYTDGNVALTLYEHGYAFWALLDEGKLLYGNVWQKGNFQIESEDVEKIKMASRVSAA